MQFWTQELMGFVVPRPAFPHLPPPPYPIDSWELQLLILLGKSLPLSFPAFLGPEPQDPKLRTSLSHGAGASKGHQTALPEGQFEGPGGEWQEGRGSYRGKVRPGSRPLGLGPGGRDSRPPPASVTRARGRGGGKGTHQYWAHTLPGPRHHLDTRQRPPRGHLCSVGERREGWGRGFGGASVGPKVTS